MAFRSSRLTPANVRALTALSCWIDEHGYPPSITDLAAELGLSRTAVAHQLRALHAKGAITREPGRARAIRIAS